MESTTSINLGLFVEEITLRLSHKLSNFITGLLSPTTQVYVVQKSSRIRYTLYKGQEVKLAWVSCLYHAKHDREVA